MRCPLAVTWASAPRAQQPPVPVIGLLGSGAAPAQSEWTAAFLQRLRELGWSEGRNIIIDYRWGEGHSERFSEIAAEFVQRKVTLIRQPHAYQYVGAKRTASDVVRRARVCRSGRSDVLWTELAEYVAARR